MNLLQFLVKRLEQPGALRHEMFSINHARLLIVFDAGLDITSS
jgi:hypothetical protein